LQRSGIIWLRYCHSHEIPAAHRVFLQLAMRVPE